MRLCSLNVLRKERNSSLGPARARSYLPPMCGRVRLSSNVREIKDFCRHYASTPFRAPIDHSALARTADIGRTAILSSRVFLARGRSAAAGYLAAGGISWLLVVSACAQTDEIQVYDASTNEPGQFSIELHNNYTPIGRKQPDFVGGIVPNHTLNGVPEWAYGVTDWLELGAYLPLYSWTGTGNFLIDGAKLRTEFVIPHAQERSFFYA